MNPVDLLKQARGSGYGAGAKPESEGETGPRSFPLTPEEIQAIGETSDCVKCYGSHKDGQFMIERVEPDAVQSQISPS